MDTAGILAVSNLDQPAHLVRAAAEQLGASHVVVIEADEPRSVIAVDSLQLSDAIGTAIDLGDQLRPASLDLELEPALQAASLYIGDRFAVDMSGERPLVLFDDGDLDLYGALRASTYALVMADPALPGPKQPIPKDPVWRRCPIGPHPVRVPADTTMCPEHQQLLGT
jgi:hypothetical protein